MKAVKEGKGGNKQQQQQKGAQSLDSPGALFPRLHVRETKNVGPRAPPRNKMALYEQLTVSSHRFQQQQQQQLTGASGSSSVRPTAPPPSFMAPQTYPAGYYLPCYIAPPMPFQPMAMMQQAVPGQNNGDMEELQRVPGLSVGDNTGQLQRLASCHSNTSTLKAASSKKRREGQEDFTVPTYQSAMCTKTVQASKTSATDSMSTAIEESRQAREQAAVSGQGQSARTFDISTRLAGYQNTSASHSRSAVFVESDRRPLQQSPSNSENNGDLDNPSDEEQTGQSRPGNSEMSEGSEASVLVDGTLFKVTSKDIMTAVGERHFWEMRKAMQRQQRLFHNQLFELHRVTKVQHLMASSGSSSIDDDTDVPPGKTLPAPTAEPTPQEAAKPVSEPGQRAPPLTASASVPVAPQKPVENHSARPPAPALAPPPCAPQEYASYPAPYFLPGTNGGYPAPYVGFNGNQWITQVPVSYPYHQPFAAPVGVYNSPYGPVFTGHSPIPFVPYPVPGYERDPRFNMAAAAPGIPSLSNSTQWINYPRPFTSLAPHPSSSLGSTHQQAFAAAAPPARKEQSINNNSNKSNRTYSKPMRTDTGSSTGFSLIQRAEPGASSTGNAAKSMEVDEQSQQQSQQYQPQHQPQPQQNSMDPALYSYFFSPVEREQRQQQLQQEQRVTPKASLVTPESAAGILQSLRRQDR